MAMPTSVTVEIEFTAGVWTDVTAYLDGQAGGSTRFGRTSPYGSASPGTLTLTLANDDGRFTPGRQVLADGVTPHPYWPNVVPRKRIRVAYVVAAVSYYRFTGYIKGWPPAMVGGDIPRVTINATTVDDRLSRVQLLQPIQQEVFNLGSEGIFYDYWPMTEAAGSTSLTDVGTVAAVQPTTLNLAGIGAGSSVTFGSDGPGVASGTAVAFAPASSSAGLYFTGRLNVPASLVTLAVWVKPSYTPAAGANGWTALSITDPTNGKTADLGIDPSFNVSYQDSNGSISVHAFTGTGWHMIAMRFDGHLFCDGVDLGTMAPLPVGGWSRGSVVSIGADHNGLSLFGGSIGQALLITGLVGPLPSSADIAAISVAGADGLGETVDARIARFLRDAGLAATDYNLDASPVALSTYDQTGKDVVTACQEAATSEGGGAVVYVGTDGKVQFRNRNDRLPGAPALTLDAEADLDGQTFTPVFDDTQIVNQVQATRATLSGSGSTQIATDTPSQNTFGLMSSSFTSYANTDADVLASAQWQLAQQRNPTYQFGQLALDLATATTAGLYAAVASVDVGARIRVTNLPPAAAPVTQLDMFVEGWADTFGTDQYTVVFDTSPAGNVPGFKWDDATFGRWQADSNTLGGALTNSATTVVIATPGGKPTFTTDPTAYPLKIVVGAEHIQLNSAPGGSTSPQTFTGATRGVDGTTAAAQASGAAVGLYPSSTWAL